MLNYLISFFFGIIEGITEWLPVSSTGHMILFDEFVKLSMSDDFKEMFLIVIQLGAILAVVVLFFWDIWPFTTPQKGLIKKDKFSMWFKIAVACIPAVILELCLGDKIDAMFYNFQTVAIMLITVGVLFIIVENWNKGRSASVTTIDEISYKYAFYIGMFQLVAALLPGTSPFRCNDHRWPCLRIIQNCCGRIYFLSCNSGYVWGKFYQNVRIWTSFYRNRDRSIIDRYNYCICSIGICDQVFDGIYQKA